MSLGEDFLGKIVLLLIAALVTGFAVPVILRQVDERKLRNQKQFEADLARQQKIIDAQVELLGKLSQYMWEFQLLAIEVSYHHGRQNDTLYKNAHTNYDEKAGHLLGCVRAEISKALHLTTTDTYVALKDLYYDGLLDLDMRLRGLIEGAGDEWLAFNHYAVYDFAERVDRVLDNLAAELRLHSRRREGGATEPS